MGGIRLSSLVTTGTLTIQHGKGRHQNTRHGAHRTPAPPSFLGQHFRHRAAYIARAADFLLLNYAVLPPPISALMIERPPMARSLDYRWGPLNQISPELAKAVVMAEDARFCQHQGVDWRAVEDVVEEAFDGDEQPIMGENHRDADRQELFLWEGRSVIRRAQKSRWRCGSTRSGRRNGISKFI